MNKNITTESGRTPSHRHSGLAPKSTNKDSESGRSMVEMLGVLAIMGVLSVGGVAGYRYAMDKLNANTIVDEVRKRAVTASQQRLLGRNIDLREYGSPDMISGAYQIYPLDRYNNSASFFGIDVTSIPQGICDHILKNKPAQCIEVLVNDTQTDTCPDGESDLTFAFANTLDPNTTDIPNVEPRCDTNTDCLDNSKPICSIYGYCESCPSDKPKWNGTTKACETCSEKTPFWNGKTCAQCTTNEHCEGNSNGTICNMTMGTCRTCFTNDDCVDSSRGKYCLSGYCTACATNADCGDDSKYCHITASYSSEINGLVDTCYKNFTGSCRSKGTLPTAIPVTVEGETIPFTTIYKGSMMNWWSAYNWCEAHNKRLFNTDNNRLGCSNPNLGKNSPGSQTGSCWADESQTILSPKMQALQKALNNSSTWVWIASSMGQGCDSASNCDVCWSFNIRPSTGAFEGYYTDDTGYDYVLCEDK